MPWHMSILESTEDRPASGKAGATVREIKRLSGRMGIIFTTMSLVTPGVSHYHT